MSTTLGGGRGAWVLPLMLVGVLWAWSGAPAGKGAAAGGPTGACCQQCPAGGCFEATSQAMCLATPGNVWLGLGSTCAANCTPYAHGCLLKR